MSDNKDVDKKEMDPELDDLLDSALQDMTKKPEQSEQKDLTEAVDGMNSSNLWSEEFIKEAAAQFENNMAAILGSFSGVPEDQITQEQIAQTFSKLAEAAAQVIKPAPGGDVVPESTPAPPEPAVQEKIDEVSAAISQTLQNLSSNAESLQTPFNDQDLAGMFNNFNLGEGGQDGNMFVPFMQGMMQSLLSKEVLYPSLKELVDKYPAWLKDNKGKVEESEYERFSKQQELMLAVCAALEPEQETDPDDVKRTRFDIVLGLMQKMQELGQPPTELVGDIGVPPVGFQAPMGGSEAGQCAIM